MPAASAHFSAVAVHGIEQYPCFVIIVIRFGYHKCPTVVQGVQIPDTTAVVFAKRRSIQPKTRGSGVTHCGMRPKCCGQKTDALFIRDGSGNQLRLVIPQCWLRKTEGGWSYAKGCHEMIPQDLRAPAPTPSHLRATVAIKGSFRGAEF